MVFGINRTLYPGYGGPNDISMSHVDYQDMMQALHSHNFSKLYSLKFKNLYQIQHANLSAILGFSLFPTYLLIKATNGIVDRNHAGYKFTIPVTLVTYIFTCRYMLYR